VVRLAGATVVCAAAAFLVAFFATGAGKSTTTPIQRHAATVAPFADPAARAVAVSLTGRPAALKLPPPPPRHFKHQVKHHAKPASVATTTPPAVTPTPVTPTPTPTPVYTPPPPKHKSSGGTGTGTTVVGP
jgi:hypothetical protein